jgi:conjugative transposon TraJ protein
MKRSHYKTASLAVMGILFPFVLHAQDFAGEIHSLQSVLDQLYDEMIPLCSQLIDVGRGLAGFGALWYIASRVWRHLANAEPIDFYPLLRPFVLGLAILLFPFVLAIINGVLDPIVSGTSAMVKGSNNSISYLLKKREDEIKRTPDYQMYGDGGDYDKWYKYTHPETADGGDNSGDGLLAGLGNDIMFAMAKAKYNLKNLIKQWMSTVLQILYEAAALCINTIRTFYLIVLAVLGPIVFGLAVFDGLQNTLVIWFARYLNYFLWLPVANLFGAIISKIQENMLKLDIKQVELYGETFFTSADTAYLIFMVIAIVGYLTVPSVASYIVSVAGENIHLGKSTNLFMGTGKSAVSAATSAPFAAAGSIVGPSAAGEKSANGKDGYMHDKLSGK